MRVAWPGMTLDTAVDRSATGARAPLGRWHGLVVTQPRTRRTAIMLASGGVATRLPAQDLERARAFYAEKLGLEPSEERPGGLLYRCARGEFAVFESDGAPSGSHTQIAWEVDDIEAVVAQLKTRGVVFEEYHLPGLMTVGGLAEVTGNYPSKGGVGERAAWFKDSEGNLLAIGQAVTRSTPRPAASQEHSGGRLRRRKRRP